MSTEKPLLDALNVSVIVDRKDQPNQVSRTEWRTDIVLVGGTPAQAGDLALLGPNGQFDPSVIPGGGGGSTISVNGTPVSNPNLNDNTPAPPSGFANVVWLFDLSGNVSAHYQLVAVNGAPVASPNFNNATPSAPPGFTNVVWQTDVNGNISGYVSTGGGESMTVFFPDDTASNVPGYGQLTTTPETAIEQTETATVSTTGVPVPFSPENSYVTAIDIPGLTVIPAGTWLFATWASVDSTSGNSQCVVQIDIYARDTGGGETLLFSVQTPTITSTSPQLLPSPFSATDFVVNATDRVVAKYSAVRTTGNQTRTVTFYHAGNQHLSRITAPIPSVTFVPFDVIASGTNTQATMTVDTGATLTFANSGVVNANELYNTPVASTVPTTKQALVFNGTAWAPADIVNSFNGRTGDVLPASGDYSYAQISGTPQLPQTFNAVTHEFLNSYNATTGLFTAAQPSAADLTNGTTGSGAVVLANAPTITGTATFTGTISATNVAISGTLADGTNSPGTAGYILSSTGTGTLWIPNTAGTVPFNDITSGTNTTATMVVGSGASLSFSGAGIVNANELYGVAISSTPPIAGQVLTATSPTTAAWQNPSTGTANFAQAIVDFSNPLGPEETTASVTVPAPWVTGVSVIMCNPFGGSTPDHGPEDAMVENLAAYATNIIPGVSFDIECYAPNGTWGRYLINAIGS